MQVSPPFELGLLDYYGNVGVAENAGICTVQYPITDNITVPDLGRSSTVTAGLAAFDVFSIIGAHLASPNEDRAIKIARLLCCVCEVYRRYHSKNLLENTILALVEHVHAAVLSQIACQVGFLCNHKRRSCRCSVPGALLLHCCAKSSISRKLLRLP